MSERSRRAENRETMKEIREIGKTKISARSRNVFHALALSRSTAQRLTPSITLTPFLSWGFIFKRLLHSALGSKSYWEDLVIKDLSQDKKQRVRITSIHESNQLKSKTEGFTPRGSVRGPLEIILQFNDPLLGLNDGFRVNGEYDSLADDDNNWTFSRCMRRNTRIGLSPAEEFVDMFSLVTPSPAFPFPDIMSYVKFPGWRNTVFGWPGSTLVRRNPVYGLQMQVYHADYNISIPAIDIVSRAIEFHYARVIFPDVD